MRFVILTEVNGMITVLYGVTSSHLPSFLKDVGLTSMNIYQNTRCYIAEYSKLETNDSLNSDPN
jgi:hypothetical protein